MENNTQASHDVTLLADGPLARIRFKQQRLVFSTTLADGDKQLCIEIRRMGNYVYTIIERFTITREDERTRVYDDCTFVPSGDIIHMARYLARMHSVYLSRRNIAISPLAAQRLVEQLLTTAYSVVEEEKS